MRLKSARVSSRPRLTMITASATGSATAVNTDVSSTTGTLDQGPRNDSDKVPRRRTSPLFPAPPMRFYEYESRRIVERAGHPGHRLRLLHHRRRGPRRRRADRRRDRDQVAGPDGRADEGGRRQVRDHAGRGGRARRGDPRARDRRPHAGRRPRRSEGRRRAGVLRGRALGRPREAPDDALLGHGRHRHRAGRRGASGPRRPRPPLEPPPRLRLPGEGDGRPLRHDRLRAQPRDDDPRPPRRSFSATST